MCALPSFSRVIFVLPLKKMWCLTLPNQYERADTGSLPLLYHGKGAAS